MNLYPFHEIVAAAQSAMNRGGVVFQQFNCEACGIKQTMAEQNKFFTEGKCEECGHVTNLVTEGCNLLVIFSDQ